MDYKYFNIILGLTFIWIEPFRKYATTIRILNAISKFSKPNNGYYSNRYVPITVTFITYYYYMVLCIPITRYILFIVTSLICLDTV